MTWADLRGEVESIFVGLDGYDAQEIAIEIRAAQRRANAVEATRLWRAMNPAAQQKISKSTAARAARKRYRDRHPEREHARRTARRAKNVERERANNRRHQAARQARLRAARKNT